MTPLTITLLVLAISVVLFVWNKLPVGIVALGVAMALWATGVLSIEQSLSGFGSTTVVLIAALIAVAEGLDSAGITTWTTWAGEQVMAHAGESPARLVVFTMIVAALLSAVLTPHGAAALLTPVATPANMMVMGPGGYRFGDYAKLGLPLMLMYLVVAVFLVPGFWPW